MARLTGHILSGDEVFVSQAANLLRSGAVPVSVTIEGRPYDSGAQPDIVVVDGRGNTELAIARVDDLRTNSPSVAIFLVTTQISEELVLQAMRAGANEFLTWPVEVLSMDEAVRRTAARRASQPGAGPHASTFVFIGTKGGAGTTTVALNCAVEMARHDSRGTVLVDLKPGLGEVALFAGVRNSYGLMDALDNLHRLDIEFLCELVVKHKSGLDILAGSEHFDRPGPPDAPAMEEIFRLLARRYARIVVDAGYQVSTSILPVLYGADTIFVIATPDVPSVRNAQRIMERIAKLGPCGDRMKLVLNRTQSPSPISKSQIEAAIGCRVFHSLPNDTATVSAALNSGTPLTMTGRTEIAKAFGQLARRIVDPEADAKPKRGAWARLKLGRIAASW